MQLLHSRVRRFLGVLIDCMADDFVHLQSRGEGGEGGIFLSDMFQLLSLIFTD